MAEEETTEVDPAMQARRQEAVEFVFDDNAVRAALDANVPVTEEMVTPDPSASPSDHILTTGDLVADRYEVTGILGKGGMGVVGLARDHRLGRRVAIKVIRKVMNNPAGLERQKREFLREAKISARLDHPNLVPVCDFGSWNDQPFIVMKHVVGHSLGRLRYGPPLTWDKAIRYIIPVLEGLAYAHKRGIVHRDLKPSNVLVGADGRVHVLDFGVAKFDPTRISRGLSDVKSLEIHGGTLLYMAPEQLLGEEEDHRADLWSVGVMLFEMMSGTLPFEERNIVTTAMQPSPAPSIREYCRDIEPEIEEFLAKALEKKPKNRFQSADEMLAMIRAVSDITADQKEVEEAGDWWTAIQENRFFDDRVSIFDLIMAGLGLTILSAVLLWAAC